MSRIDPSRPAVPRHAPAPTRIHGTHAMSEVVLENVSKVYPGGVKAVDRFSLRIADGEFVVLVGPSGCGKSTTLRMVAGLEEISEGTISIGDRVVNEVHPKDRDIAMVFQNYALYPHMSVYRNMAFALKLRKMPRAEIDRRVRDTARILGIDALLDRKPKALSGGQRQRVALARAIVREPRAFLFDEPLSNLDAKLRVETRAELKHLHLRLGTTTMYVTHDQEEAMTLGDRVVILADGVVQQTGRPMDVYREPVNRFVASFLGMPPMNFLEGRIERDDGAIRFRETGSTGVLVDLPEPLAGRAAERDGQPLVLGVRPEAFALADGSASGPRIDFSVGVIEPLGDRVDLYLEADSGTRVTARVDPRGADLEPRRRVTLAIDPTRMHLFEPGPRGVRIAGRAAGAPA